MATDQRSLPTRRKADIELLTGLAALLGIILSAGVAWGTATSAMAQKVDRAEYNAHVAESARRFQSDSIQQVMRMDAMTRIEKKLDSTNDRLSRLICNRQPAYCR